MPPFWVGFSKQGRKPSSLAPSERNEKTPLGSNFTISVSCHNFGGLIQAVVKAGLTKVAQLRSKRVFSTFPIGEKRKNTLGIEFYNFGFMPQFWWAYSSSGKSRVDEGRPIAFKTRFFNFPHRGETKKHAWDRILQFRFHATILVGLLKKRKKPGSRRSSTCVQNAFFQLCPSWRNEKTPLGSYFTISISWHHFGWAFPSSGKSRVDEGRPIAVKTRFFNFTHRGVTKKHPWDRILQFRFYGTI